MKKHSTTLPIVELPTEFSVVGEHRFDPDRLLLCDCEGHYFELWLKDGSVTSASPGAEWLMDHTPKDWGPYHAA